MKIFLLFISVLIFGCVGDSEDNSFSERNRNTLSTTEEYIELMNEHREKLGLRPLIQNSFIEEIAQEHSLNMSNGIVPFGHLGMSTRCNRLSAQLSSNACGEIVARGQESSDDVLASWLNSPSHRASIEDSKWTHTGVSLSVNSSGVHYWTQIFLRIP
jgi:uncharacterized protein YkwD